MIIWSGMGKVVPTVAIICMFVFVPLGMFLMPGDGGAAAGVVAAGLVSALLVHLVVKGAEKQAAAQVAAGQPVTGETDPGSFFFIPTKTWVFLLPIVGVVLAFFTKTQGPG